MTYDVIIIGSGPSGLTAGIYTARAALNTLIIAGTTWGGQLMQTTDVENFPGFPDGIQGPELMMHMRKQAERFGVTFVDKNVSEIDVSKKPFGVIVDGERHDGRAVIIATGADAMWLGVPGEDTFKGKGVSSCAPCDAFFYKEKNVIVVGGGDSAMEEALVLTKFAKHVTVVHRKDAFRASKIMQDRVLNHEKIDVLWNTEIVEMIGEQKLTKVKLKTNGKESEKDIDGVFVAIGHKPNSVIFTGKIDLDTKGYVLRKPHDYQSSTSVDGVFTGGDIHDYTYRQAITAAGYGCQAAMDCERWLEEMHS